jgi:hypothetical protein
MISARALGTQRSAHAKAIIDRRSRTETSLAVCATIPHARKIATIRFAWRRLRPSFDGLSGAAGLKKIQGGLHAEAHRNRFASGLARASSP